MTLTFNSEKYSELLVKYQPKLIRTETEEEFTLRVNRLQITVLFSLKLSMFLLSNLDCGEQELSKFVLILGFHKYDDCQ